MGKITKVVAITDEEDQPVNSDEMDASSAEYERLLLISDGLSPEELEDWLDQLAEAASRSSKKKKNYPEATSVIAKAQTTSSSVATPTEFGDRQDFEQSLMSQGCSPASIRQMMAFYDAKNPNETQKAGVQAPVLDNSRLIESEANTHKTVEQPSNAAIGVSKRQTDPTSQPKADDNTAEKAEEGVVALDDYEFPICEDAAGRFRALSDDELLQTLSALIGVRKRDRASTSYLDIRDEYCAISSVMNDRGLMPPAFRPKRSLPPNTPSSEYTDDETLMMLDRQIIDLHWLHCRHVRRKLPKGKYEELFLDDEFDYDLAEQFALEGWRSAIKVTKVLNLTGYEEWQMAIFQSTVVKDAWRNARVSMNETVDRRLREHTVKEPGFTAHIDDMKRLWLADKIAGHEGPKTVREVDGWLAGRKPLAPSTFSAKIKRMRRRTAPKGAARKPPSGHRTIH